MLEVLTPALTFIDVDLGHTPKEVVAALLLPFSQQHNLSHPELLRTVLEREKQVPTGLTGGLAIPHARIGGLDRPYLLFARLTEPVAFGATDGPADLVFLLLSPGEDKDRGGVGHLKLLQNLVAQLMAKDFLASLRAETSPVAIAQQLNQAANRQSLLDFFNHQNPVAGMEQVLIVAVTNCPTGIAHTYMAADALLAAARDLPIVLRVEAQGAGQYQVLDPEVIARAGAVIFANGIAVREPERFAHLPAVYATPKQAISQPQQLLLAALKQVHSRGNGMGENHEGTCPTTGNGIKETLKLGVSNRELPPQSEGRLVVDFTGSSASGENSTGTLKGIDSSSDTVCGGGKTAGTLSNRTLSNRTEPTGIRSAGTELAGKADRNRDEKQILPSGNISKNTSENTLGTTAVSDPNTLLFSIPVKLSAYRRIQQAVMAGVSYMIPFVAAGGLLTAIGLFLIGYHLPDPQHSQTAEYTIYNLFTHLSLKSWENIVTGQGILVHIGALCLFVGHYGMYLMIPALSGYISFGLAGRPGIAPGFISGMIAVTVGSGFIGALVAGILSGAIAYGMGKPKLPPWLHGLMPVIVIPTVTAIITGGLLVTVLGGPLRQIFNALQTYLGQMGESSAVLLGALLGAMMCLDLGGPVNKAALLFATAGLAEGSLTHPEPYRIMAAVMCAGMVPPFATALATVLRPQWYSRAQKEHAKAAWLLGVSFITEGAIPFAAADPFRVVPSLTLGGAFAGGLSMWWQVSSPVPHGGLFVLFTIHPWGAFLGALLGGTLLASMTLTAAKAVYFHRHPQAVNDPQRLKRQVTLKPAVHHSEMEKE